MKKWRIIISFLVVVPVICLVVFVLNANFRLWVEFHTEHRDYLQWREAGGPLDSKFYTLLNLDRDRDKLVEGLSYDQIKAKLPFLSEDSRFSPDGYKGRYLKILKT